MARKTSPYPPRRPAPSKPTGPGTLAHLAGGGGGSAAVQGGRPGAGGPAGAAHAAEARRLVDQARRHLAQGDAGAAERAFREALARDRTNPQALAGLGMMAGQAGVHAEAARLFMAAAQAQPQAAEHMLNAATALWQMGQRSQALPLFDQAARRAPRDGRARLAYGKALLEAGDLAGAEREGRAARKGRDADKCQTAVLLGRVLMRQGRAEAAVAELRAAAGTGEAPPWLLNELGQALLAAGAPDEAGTAFQRVFARGVDQPGALEAGAGLVSTHLAAGRIDAAEAVLAEVRAVVPNHLGVMTLTGDVLAARRRFDEARAAYRRVLEANPDDLSALRGMVRSGAIDDDALLLSALENAAGRQDLDAAFRADALFALAKAREAHGAAPAAVFSALDEGHRLKRVQWDGGLAGREATIKRMMASYTPEVFLDRAGLGDDSERPVLIVGMLRSGTTLVEQIIASHSQAAAGGEMTTWPDLDRDLAARSIGVADMKGEDAASFRRMVHEVLDGVAREAGKPDAVRVTDKMPDNAILLGLFALLFPRGRVIVCRRDPMDIGFSMYQQNFTSVPFAHALEDIGRAMVMHDRIMAHWRTVLPVPMLTVDYETLVTDLEGGSRRLIDFLGLPWEDRVLRFYETDRAVHTASKWQVRQPVYTRSVGRWRRYAEQLEPLRAVLAEAGLGEGPL